MDRSASVGTKLFTMFAALVAAIVIVALTSLFAVRRIGNEEENASSHAARLVGISHLVTQTERMAAANREYLQRGGGQSLDRMRAASVSFGDRVAQLRDQLPAREAARMLDDIVSAERTYSSALTKIAERPAGTSDAGEIEEPQRHAIALRAELLTRVALLRKYEERQSDLAERLATRDTRRALAIVLIVAIAALGAATALAIVLTRTLRALDQRQRERDRYLAQLQAANSDLDAFAGRIAHDLRNALAPVSAWCMVLKNARGDPEILGRIVGRLEGNAKKMVALLDSLLAFSRAGGPPDSAASAPVARVAVDVINGLRDLAIEADATIEQQVIDVDVACNPALLHILLANLVQNALKFVRGRSTRHVLIAAAVPNADRCEIVVEDTGPGIAPDKVGNIFEPFYRVPGVTAPGTGIGLATVRRIVEAHGGRAVVESWPGVGSRFTVELPLAKESRAGSTRGNGRAPNVSTAA